MDKRKIIAKTIEKLAKLDMEETSDFLRKFERISDDPRKVIELVQGFQDQNKMDQHNKLKFLNEIKKKKLFKIDTPNVERAWRLILKNWDLPSYKLWSQERRKKTVLIGLFFRVD